MPDPINPQGTANEPQGTGNDPQGTQQQQQEPAWFQHIPAEHREAAKESWMLKGDYTKKTQEISERQKAWEKEKSEWENRGKEWETFQQAYQPFYRQLQARWNEIAPILEGRQAPPQQQQAQPSQDGADPFEQYDVLPPKEQAKRVAEFVAKQHFQPLMTAIEQKIMQALQQREQYYGNYLNVFTDAFERKASDPSLNIREYIKKMQDLQGGRENLSEIAYSALTNDARTKAMQEEWFKKGQEEKELQYKNQQQTNGALQNSAIPYFKQKPLSRDQVTEAVRADAVKKGIVW